MKHPETAVPPAPDAGAALAAAQHDVGALQTILAGVAPQLRQVEAAVAEITTTHAPYVRGLVEHVRGFGGKRLRPALVILAGQAVNAAAVGDVHARVGAVVELIHTATLVHDDILDQALMRRMRPTLHNIEGTEVSVLLGDFLLASAYAEAAALEDRLASRYLSQITRQVCQGEVLQIHNRGNLDLGEREYFEIIEKKTAILYAASCDVGARYAGGSPEQVDALHAYGRHLGLAFQIGDDILDLTGDEQVVGKSLGTDLARCKLTLPLIHFVRHGAPDAVASVREALSAGRGADEAAAIRAAVADAGSIEYASRCARRHLEEAGDALDRLPETPARATLREVAAYVLARRR